MVKRNRTLTLFIFTAVFDGLACLYSTAVVKRWIKFNCYINVCKIILQYVVSHCISGCDYISATFHSLFLHPSGALVMSSIDSWPVVAVPWTSSAFYGAQT